MNKLEITIGVILLMSTAVVATPMLSGYASTQSYTDEIVQAQLAENLLQDPGGPPNTDPGKPSCRCSKNAQVQEFTKVYNYASDMMSCIMLDPMEPNSKGIATHRKTICENGSFWTCTYETGQGCTDVEDFKPTCPEGSCNP